MANDMGLEFQTPTGITPLCDILAARSLIALNTRFQTPTGITPLCDNGKQKDMTNLSLFQTPTWITPLCDTNVFGCILKRSSCFKPLRGLHLSATCLKAQRY